MVGIGREVATTIEGIVVVAAVCACRNVGTIVEGPDVQICGKYPRIVTTVADAIAARRNARWSRTVWYLTVVDEYPASAGLRHVDVRVTGFGQAEVVHHGEDSRVRLEIPERGRK